MKWWTERLGKKKVLDIRARHVRTALDEYAEGKAKRCNGPRKVAVTTRAPGTVNRMQAGLSAIFKYARTEGGYGIANPVTNVPTRRENNQRTRWLSDDERKALNDGTICRGSCYRGQQAPA